MKERTRNQEYQPQTIWGINRKDRHWFTIMTAGAGATWTAAIAQEIIATVPGSSLEEPVLAAIAKGMAAAFAASGFGTWTILSIKDAAMSLGDAIRERTFKRTQAIMEAGRAEGRAEGREQALKDLAAKAEAEGQTDLLELIRKTANGNNAGD